MVVDTNVLILFSKGDEAVVKKLSALREPLFISRISYIEFLADKLFSPQEREAARQFLTENFMIIDIDQALADVAITVRSKTILKIPDAIIAATALKQNDTLYTFDRQIQRAMPEVVYPLY